MKKAIRQATLILLAAQKECIGADDAFEVVLEHLRLAELENSLTIARYDILKHHNIAAGCDVENAIIKLNAMLTTEEPKHVYN